MSLAMETPSFVIVGAPHFLSSTTLRPLGSQGDAHRVRQFVHTALEGASRFFVESNQFRHGQFLLCENTSLVHCNISSLSTRVLTEDLAARHRRDQGDRLAGLELRVETVEETNVLVGHENVHETTQHTLVVEHPRGPDPGR